MKQKPNQNKFIIKGDKGSSDEADEDGWNDVVRFRRYVPLNHDKSKKAKKVIKRNKRSMESSSEEDNNVGFQDDL